MCRRGCTRHRSGTGCSCILAGAERLSPLSPSRSARRSIRSPRWCSFRTGTSTWSPSSSPSRRSKGGSCPSRPCRTRKCLSRAQLTAPPRPAPCAAPPRPGSLPREPSRLPAPPAPPDPPRGARVARHQQRRPAGPAAADPPPRAGEPWLGGTSSLSLQPRREGLAGCRPRSRYTPEAMAPRGTVSAARSDVAWIAPAFSTFPPR